MPLGEFSMICFEFLSDFWRKSQNEQGGKTRQKSGLRHNEGHLRRLPCYDEAEGPERPPPPLRFSKA